MITGRFVNEHKEPIVNGRVRLVDYTKPGDVTKPTDGSPVLFPQPYLTDKDGYFSFVAPATGTYKVCAEAFGGHSSEMQLPPHPDANLGDLTMKVGPLVFNDDAGNKLLYFAPDSRVKVTPDFDSGHQPGGNCADSMEHPA